MYIKDEVCAYIEDEQDISWDWGEREDNPEVFPDEFENENG